ncbi:hypothetical protein EXS65_00785 [Candidatus Peribacteria bacterium]|nr:hypothetical protein [Candidatus Peribacteria bacterium]
MKSDYNPPVTRTLTLIYATSTGHTEFVVDTLQAALGKILPDLRIIKQRAEVSTSEDLEKSDILLLACGSWNTGNVEGQLQPHMHELLTVRAAEAELKGKPAAAIGLGDDRYYFTARAAEKLTEYLIERQATLLLPTLIIINDPFDQTAKIEAWAKEFATAVSKLPAVHFKT